METFAGSVLSPEQPQEESSDHTDGLAQSLHKLYSSSGTVLFSQVINHNLISLAPLAMQNTPYLIGKMRQGFRKQACILIKAWAVFFSAFSCFNETLVCTMCALELVWSNPLLCLPFSVAAFKLAWH